MGVWSMTGEQLTSKADQIADNAFLKLAGRLGMAVAMPIVVAGTTWLGSTFWTFQTEISKQAGRIDVLSERINQSLDDRYRASDARRDFQLRDQKDVEQDRRLQRLEDRTK